LEEYIVFFFAAAVAIAAAGYCHWACDSKR